MRAVSVVVGCSLMVLTLPRVSRAQHALRAPRVQGVRAAGTEPPESAPIEIRPRPRLRGQRLPRWEITPQGAERDRFEGTLSILLTTGLSSPLGLAGIGLEWRPFRWISAGIGAGAGGSFGPALAASLYFDPIVTTGWALGVGGSLSHNFAFATGPLIPGGSPLPDSSQWFSLEAQTQIRPNANVFVRIGFGYAFMLNTEAFHVATAAQLQAANLRTGIIPTVIDAALAADRREGYGLFYFHVDLAPTWKL